MVWIRGWLATLQFLTSSSSSLVEENRGFSGQRVSISLIDAGILLLPAELSLLFLGSCLTQRDRLTQKGKGSIFPAERPPEGGVDRVTHYSSWISFAFRRNVVKTCDSEQLLT